MAEQLASYKGRNYAVKWYGKTKTDKQLHKLAFLDGSKEFWADSSLVGAPLSSPASTGSSSYQGRRNWRPCGYPGCSPQMCDECM